MGPGDSVCNPGSPGGQGPCPLTNTPVTTGNPQAGALGLAGHVPFSSAAQDLLQLTYRVCEREPISLQIEAQLQLLEGYTRPLSPDFFAFL